jgi:transcriptional regulator GlxA family with amidase domain
VAAPAGGRLTGTAGASPDLIRLRQARDRMDREYAEPLDVPALAHTAFMSPGHFNQLGRGPGPAATRRAPVGR